MQPLIAFNRWPWIEAHRQAFEPPVGHQVIWEDSQFTAMIIRGPNARRDFHVDPSDEIFYMLTGDMVLEYIQDGQRQTQVIR
jgi:3-hydroxyanthranilate 3,4-dioxygenase